MGHVRESAHGRFAPYWVEQRRGLVALCNGGEDGGEGNEEDGGLLRTLCAIVVAVDIENADGALVAHALLGDAHDLLVVVGKVYTLDGRRELPHEEALARLHGPEPHFVVCRTRDEEA